VSCDSEYVPFDESNRCVFCAAQTCGALNDSIQNGLNISRRLGDHPQDLAGSRLLLQRLCEISVAFLQFLEQPHVLDGDHGLGCEGFEQFDLFIAERPNFEPPDKDNADRNALAEQGCR